MPLHIDALERLIAAHLEHLGHGDARGVDDPHWSVTVESDGAVGAARHDARLSEADLPRLLAASAPDRLAVLYTADPVPGFLADAADEAGIAMFVYSERGRVEAADRTAARLTGDAWYPPAGVIVPPQPAAPTDHAEDAEGRPGPFEAASGWLVLLLFLGVLAAVAYIGLRWLGVV
jgi:hypothetical protein